MLAPRFEHLYVGTHPFPFALEQGRVEGSRCAATCCGRVTKGIMVVGCSAVLGSRRHLQAQGWGARNELMDALLDET